MTSSVSLHPESWVLPHIEGNILPDALVTRGIELKIIYEFS